MTRTRKFPKFCSVDCRPTCSIDGCEKPYRTLDGLCAAHAQRKRTYGDPLEPLRQGKNSGSCAVPECESPARKLTWCASHYEQQRMSGLPPEPFKHKWSTRVPCMNCGSSTEDSIHRRFCSDNCRVTFTSHGGPRATHVNCVACGDPIDLNEKGKRGLRRRVDVKFCNPCRQDYDKYKMTARELAVRDGTDCGICGTTVDMTLPPLGRSHAPVRRSHSCPRQWRDA